MEDPLVNFRSLWSIPRFMITGVKGKDRGWKRAHTHEWGAVDTLEPFWGDFLECGKYNQEEGVEGCGRCVVYVVRGG